MSKFLTKSEEYELMWEKVSPINESNVQPINVLIESKHILEGIIKTINNHSSNTLTPITEKPKDPPIKDVVALYETLDKISNDMGIDKSLQPVI